MSPVEVSKKLTIVVCGECARMMNSTGLCSYGCVYDGVPLEERGIKESVKTLTYKLVKEEYGSK
jgi:hypothetical protein